MVSEEEEISSIRGRCDICDKKDLIQGGNLLKCKSCGVCVHKNCYGETADETSPNWVCKACEAVGKEFVGRKYGSDKTYKIVQKERPMECVLCSIRTGNHAMHMVYDKEEKVDGCPLILSGSSAASKTKDGSDRIAWAHSLCAFSVCTNPNTRGCIYGDEGTSGKDEEDFIPMDHLVFSDIDPWQRIIDEHRNKLVCDVCGQRDNRKNVLRIALQCHAGDCNEFSQFQGCHSNLRQGECCYSAMHVGCARWGKHKNGSDYANQRVYFYPGKNDEDDDEHSDPVLAIYCHLHAKDAKNRNKKQKSADKNLEKRNKLKSEKNEEDSDFEQLGFSTIEKKEEQAEQEDYSPTSKKNFNLVEKRKNESPSQLASPSGRSVYFERKRLIENTYYEALDEARKCIKRAKQSNSSVENSLNRLKSHLSNHSGLRKKEFKLVWERVEDQIDKAWNKTTSQPDLNTKRKSTQQEVKAETRGVKRQISNISKELSQQDKEQKIKQILIDFRRARKRVKKSGASYDELLSRIKKFWRDKVETTTDEFEGIWIEALDKAKEISESNLIQNISGQEKTENVIDTQTAVVETPADNWSFLSFGPHYSITKAYEYFQNWN